jgi:hypothetical protein
MKAMADRVVMERLVRGRAPGREFDIEFWQALGPSRILEAAWELVVTAASAKGIHESQLRLQRSVEHYQRGRRAVSDRGRVRGDDLHGTHYTKDLDIWIDRSDTNAQAVFKALAQFGAPLNLRVFSRSTLPNLTCFIR